MKLKIIEPLRELFKDEVRELGKRLKIKEKLILRHPFPGPGLAIRIPGIITLEKINILQNIDDIFIDFLKEKNFIIRYGKLLQFYFQLNLLESWVMKGLTIIVVF